MTLKKIEVKIVQFAVQVTLPLVIKLPYTTENVTDMHLCEYTKLCTPAP